MFASNKAIISRFLENYKALNGSDDRDFLSGLEGDCDENEAIDILIRRVLQGDAAADAAFEKAVQYSYAFLVSIINTYNPSLIIIECRWMKRAKKYFNEVVSQVFDRNTLLDRNDVKIMLNPVEDIFSNGCSTIVLEQLFSGIDNNLIG